jgi:uncharacterized protein (DUF305 family)
MSMGDTRSPAPDATGGDGDVTDDDGAGGGGTGGGHRPLPPLPGWLKGLAVASLAVVCLVIGLNLGRPDVPGETSVDVGFLRDMIDHHDQGVAIGQLVARADIDPIVAGFGQEVVILQRWEVGKMDAWLADWGHARGDLDRRDIMGWMGSPPLRVADMPGMQPEERLEALEAATGVEKERLFLTMMRAHHEGGVHMAEYAAEHASTEKVRDFAEFVATNQRKEVREYDLKLAELS